MQLGAIILAGGRSRRMGRPKEALPWRDHTLLAETVQTLLMCTHPVVVVAREEAQELPPYPMEADLVFDDTPGAGPMGALVAGLRAVDREADAVFVTGCDTPLLSGDTVAWLANQLGEERVLVPEIDGHLQILSSVMRLEVLGAAEQMLDEGVDTPRTLVERCPSRVLKGSDLASCPEGIQAFQSLNTPEDYERARAAAGGA